MCRRFAHQESDGTRSVPTTLKDLDGVRQSTRPPESSFLPFGPLSRRDVLRVGTVAIGSVVAPQFAKAAAGVFG